MKSRHSFFFKRVVPIITVCLGVVILTMSILPLVIDVDKYRPQLITWVNSQIEGELELGRIQLSLWGQLGVKIAHAELVDASRKPVLSTGEFSLAVPVSSLMKGQPQLVVRLSKPKIVFERNEKGLWNIATLIKKSDNPEEKPKPAPDASEAKAQLPDWVGNASVSLDVQQADLEISDLKTQAQYQLKSLALTSDAIVLNRLPGFQLKGVLDSSFSPSGRIRGPFRIAGVQDQNDFSLSADFTAVKIVVGNHFEKNENIPFTVKFKAVESPEVWNLTQGQLVFHQAVLNFEGALGKKSGSASQTLQWKSELNNLVLDEWSELLPSLDKSLLKGKVKSVLSASGTVDAPKAQVEASLEGGQFQGKYFKRPLDFSAVFKADLDSVDQLKIQMNAPGFDVRIASQINSFEKPSIVVQGESNEMDFDQLMDWEKMKKDSLAAAPVANSEALKKTTPPVEKTGRAVSVPDYDTPLAFLSKNDLAKKASGVVTWNGKSLKFYNVHIEPLKGKFLLKNLVVSGGFEEARLWGGSARAAGEFSFQGERPKYKFQGQLNTLSLQEAVASQMNLFKNITTGLLSAQFEGTGESFNPVLAKKNLNAKGKVKVKPAKLSSIDMNKMISEGLQEAMVQIGNKVPSLKGKELRNEPITSEFSQMTGTFSIQDGVFSAPDFFAEAVPKKGVDVRGDTQIGLIDYALNAQWEISDPYNLLKAQDLHLDQGGIQVQSVLVERGKPFRLPIRVSGTLLSPKYDYGLAPEFLAKIALSNLGLAAQDKAKSEVTKKAKEEVKKLTDQAPKPVQDILKSIFR